MKKTQRMFSMAALVAGLAFLGACATGGAGGGAPAGEVGAMAPPGYRYFCNCGPTCSCGTSAAKPGTCACGKPMALRLIASENTNNYGICPDNKVGPDKRCADGSSPQVFPKAGKYRCACPNCNCDATSNSPGKCVCGVEMQPR